MDFWKFVESNPVFQQQPATQSLDEFRRITSARMYALFDKKCLKIEDAVIDPRIVSIF